MSLQRLVVTNWLALVVSLVAHFVLGMLWYGALGGPWMTAIGKNMDQLNATVPQSVYVIPVISTIVLTLAVAKVMDLADERGLTAGVKWALFLWAFVMLPFPVLHYAFAGNSPTLTLVDGGIELVGAVLTGIILGTLGFRTATAPRPAVATAAA